MGLAILLMFLFFTHKGERKLLDVLIKAIILWTLIAYVSLEALSLFSMVTFKSLLFIWCSVDIILLIYFGIQMQHRKWSAKKTILDVIRIMKNNWLWTIPSIALIVLAIFTVPYNWDSMIYHLSRIANWA